MNLQQYQQETTSTFKPRTALDAHQAEVLDWTVGLSGEVGEVSELIKHHIFHSEELDKMKLAKEIGDVLWYLSALCASTGIPMEACAELNIAKLQHRHGGKFSFSKSADRHQREAKFENTPEYLHLKNKIEGLKPLDVATVINSKMQEVPDGQME